MLTDNQKTPVKIGDVFKSSGDTTPRIRLVKIEGETGEFEWIESLAENFKLTQKEMLKAWWIVERSKL